ncbi:MAG: sigma-54-dependent transcriptional regulator [Candidatus Methylomirabilales bacterium]
MRLAVPREDILVVDDEPNILKVIGDILTDEGYRVRTAHSGEEAVAEVQRSCPDLMILDIWLPGMDGLQALDILHGMVPETPVIMISGHGNIETAVRAIKMGAYDFIEKPPTIERTILAVRHGLEQQRLVRENRALRQTLERRYEIVGESPAIRGILQQVESVAPSHGRVLIRGESGTGKELIARAIHRASLRRERPFVEVNCAAIPDDLIESELFGHEKGAFTGALTSRRGKFELADGGTLFLDEVGDMSLKTQAKVLRVLEEQAFERVGGAEAIRVDVRVIAASNKDLEEETRVGRFREDLYYRLNVVPVEVLPLRERREDIPLLARHFLKSFCAEYGKKGKSLSPDAMELFLHHPWPGNVRELRNVIERLVIMVPGDVIQGFHVDPALQARPIREEEVSFVPDISGAASLREARNRFEREYILMHLRENQWNVTRTAERLKIERSNLHRKLKAYGIGGPPEQETHSS